MEVKSCEEYVLNELDTYKKKYDKLLEEYNERCEQLLKAQKEFEEYKANEKKLSSYFLSILRINDYSNGMHYLYGYIDISYSNKDKFEIVKLFIEDKEEFKPFIEDCEKYFNKEEINV